MKSPDPGPIDDPVVRRSLGVILLLIAVTVLLIVPWFLATSTSPLAMPVVAGIAGGLGAIGILLLLRPRRRPS
jgi:hypothetical protein